MGNAASPPKTKGEHFRAVTGPIERGTKRRRNSEPPFNVARMDLRTGRLQDMPHFMPLLMKEQQLHTHNYKIWLTLCNCAHVRMYYQPIIMLMIDFHIPIRFIQFCHTERNHGK